MNIPKLARQTLLAMVVAVATLPITAAPASAAGNGATVSHYTASYPCPCFGHIDVSGVHLTNQRFPGSDYGPTSADTVGGRDNFSGTVADPPDTQLVFTGPGGTNCDVSDMWESDYNGNLFTCDWSWTINPDGSTYGWAVYPDGP